MHSKGFLVDIDGVFFPSEEAKVSHYDLVAQEVCDEFGYVYADFPPHPRGRPTSETLGEWVEEASGDEKEIRADLVKGFKPRYKKAKENIYDTIEPYAEAQEFIEGLMTKGPVCLVTTVEKLFVGKLAARYDWFAKAAAHLVAHGDFEKGKPNPEPYLMAARKIGLDPVLCFAVEDSGTGVCSALAAGVGQVFHIHKWQDIPDDLKPQVTQITDLRDIFSYL
ncbi:MAG TPA: HAD family phosphatase [Candidatus Gracilibacteria bacterium]